MDNQLAALTASGWALCDVVLDIGQGDGQLALCLNEAHLLVDPLIAEGIHYGKHVALMSVGSHYGGIDFDAVG